jgi:energy-coupling factor transport system ATP-binding protein
MSQVKNNISVTIGINFSGRSEYLKNQCNKNGIYIGEIPSNYLTGVAPTVKDELELFYPNSKEETQKVVNKLINKFGFDRLFKNNPFLLSGGEQVLLTILSGILAEPQLLAIDTAIEQLSDEWKNPLFEAIMEDLKEHTFLLADNRIEEYGIPYTIKSFNGYKHEYEYSFNKPELIEFNSENIAKKIVLKDLWFSYKNDIPVLKDINIAFQPGNIYFLKGINGAGKSTLAKILSGILKIKKGTISLNDELYNPYKRPGTIFGYSFQNPDEQLFSISVSKEILKHKKNETKDYSERRDIFLKMFGLENIENLHPAELPFVMRKRVALAATLAYDRPWYIIDEPTIGQDNHFIDFLVKLFTYLISTRKGIIIISHSQAFIKKFEAKILYLENGFLKTN